MSSVNKEKWSEMYAEAKRSEKQVLKLYRVFFVHPFRVFLLFVFLGFIRVATLEIDSFDILSSIFHLVIAPAFFFFGFKFAVWCWLRMQGFPAEYLKLKE